MAGKVSKELKVRSFVRIDGVYHLWEDIPPEKQKEIGIALNDRSLRSIGYVPVPVDDKTA